MLCCRHDLLLACARAFSLNLMQTKAGPRRVTKVTTEASFVDMAAEPLSEPESKLFCNDVRSLDLGIPGPLSRENHPIGTCVMLKGRKKNKSDMLDSIGTLA